MDCNLPGSSIHGILQARILEWVAISFSRGSSWPRDWTQVSCIAGRCFNLWATREAQNNISIVPIVGLSLKHQTRAYYKLEEVAESYILLSFVLIGKEKNKGWFWDLLKIYI